MENAVLIEIQRLFQLVRQRGLRELSLSREGFSVTIVAAGKSVAAHAQPTLAAAEEDPAARGTPVVSPLVGIFYLSPSPDAPPIVEVGDRVEVGQTIGIVEAMKVFNEITTDHAGAVIAIPAEDGKLVQMGQPLIILEVES